MMKKYLCWALTMMLSVSLFQGCYDDSKIWEVIADHESRLSYLEEKCEQINTNIASIQYLIETQLNGDYIVSTKPYLQNGKEIGYIITFHKRGPIIIYHGSNGHDGEAGLTPVIAVKLDSDGVYYWTINGEWLLGEDGEKIKAVGTDGDKGDKGDKGEDGADGLNGTDGLTPEIGVKKDTDGVYYWTINGEWLLGEDGEKIKAVGTDGESVFCDPSCYFSNIEQTADGYVIFTLANGTLIKVPTWEMFYTHDAFSIIFDATEFVIGDNIEELSIPFKLIGALGAIEIDAIVLSRNDGQSAEIEMSEEADGVVNIFTGGYTDFDILVIASNNGRTTHKLLTVTKGSLSIYDYFSISGAGGNIEIPVITNYDYEVVIPDEYSSWISYVDIKTRAELREEAIVVSIARNTTDMERTGEIELRDRNFGSVLAKIYVAQMPWELKLSVDKTKFQADGNDSVTFTVKSGSRTITEGVEFYNADNERLTVEDFRFKTTESDSYAIYAKYDGIISNYVYVLAIGEDTPQHIAIYGETGDDNIECAVFGLDGSVYYYHENTSVPGQICKISKFNTITDEVEYIVNFNDEGNVKHILTPELTIVIGNYHDNYADVMIFFPSGEREILRDVEIADVSRLMTKSPSGIEIANLAISGVATGLEIAAIASVGVAAAAPVSIVMAALGVGCLAYDAATAFDLIPEGSVGGELTAHLLGKIGHYVDMGINVPTNKLELAAALAGIAAHCFGLAELMESAADHDIVVGEGNVNPSGSISATLTWSASADIDLHCEGPSGHIYYMNKHAGSGYLDTDNTSAYGPETIYYSNPSSGSYSFYIHYYAENNGVSSVNYSVTVNSFGDTEVFSGTISGQGSKVHIKTILVGGVSNTRSSSYNYNNCVIDWNNLPPK